MTKTTIVCMVGLTIKGVMRQKLADDTSLIIALNFLCSVNQSLLCGNFIKFINSGMSNLMEQNRS